MSMARKRDSHEQQQHQSEIISNQRLKLSDDDLADMKLYPKYKQSKSLDPVSHFASLSL